MVCGQDPARNLNLKVIPQDACGIDDPQLQI